MPTMPPTFRAKAQPTRREQNRQSDQRRGSARQRGYTTAWDKAAKGHLNSHPLCAYCALADIVTLATLVDHLYPHQGDQVVFWRREHWVSSCGECHNGFKQRIERAGRLAIDALALRLGLNTATPGGG